MTCVLCKRKGHNKRRCKNPPVAQEPPTKRPHGRPTTVSSSFAAPQPNNDHTSATAHTLRTGRGGRVICRKRGGRGGGTGGGRAGGNVGTLGGRGRGRGGTWSTSSEGGRGGSSTGKGRCRGRGRGKVPRDVGVLVTTRLMG